MEPSLASPTLKVQRYALTVRSLFTLAVGLSLAALSPAFANRLLAVSAQLMHLHALGTIMVLLFILGALLFLTISAIDSDDVLMTAVISAILVLGGSGVLLWMASLVNPNNGWSHLAHVSNLQWTQSSILSEGGRLDHPANRRIAQALASLAVDDTRTASHWVDDQDMLSPSETHRVRLALSLLGQADTPLARDMAGRGWVGKRDLAALKTWAIAHPVPPSVSSLHADAWLHLVGEKSWSDALKITVSSPDKEENK